MISEIDIDLSAYTWSENKRGRIIRKDGRKLIKLHRVIADRMGINGEVDHADGNLRNNTRGNLRPATRSENNCNRRKFGGSTSKYKGVYREKGKWCAAIRFKGQRFWLGYYTDEAEAARAYDREALKLHRQFAVLNFPDNASLHPSPKGGQDRLIVMPDGINQFNASPHRCDMADGPCCCGAWHHLGDWDKELPKDFGEFPNDPAFLPDPNFIPPNPLEILPENLPGNETTNAEPNVPSVGIGADAGERVRNVFKHYRRFLKEGFSEDTAIQKTIEVLTERDATQSNKDTERLDWMASHEVEIVMGKEVAAVGGDFKTIREAIDAAMSQTK